jgi:membrane associated rhomboid family serine protease
MAYSDYSGSSNPFGFTVTPMVKRLIFINGAAFLLFAIFRGLEPFFVFDPRSFVPQVWTPLTYMFVHIGLFHLLFNMLALFFFGPPLEERWGSTQFLKFFFLTGLGGALLSLLFPNPIAGASAAVYGVLVAYAMYWPNNPIYFWGIFPIKAKYLVGFFVGLSVFSAVTGSQAGVAHLAHLGGAIAAFAYLKSPWAPPAWGGVAKRSTERPWSSTLASLVRPAPKPAKVTPVATAAARKPDVGRRPLDDVDRILDKISEGGIDSLTEEERRRLEEASRRFRAS